MPEAVGIFTIPERKHQAYKKCAESIFSTAPANTRRMNEKGNDLEHISNFNNQNIFNDFPKLKGLKEDLKEFSIQYIDLIGFTCDEVVITDAWLNRANINAIQKPHSHNNSFLSGTYYINFNPKKHSQITFYNHKLLIGNNTNPSISLPRSKNNSTPYNSKELLVKCKEGQVLIWKSHLIHGYKTPNKLKNRLTLSFNIMPRTCTDGNAYSFTINE